LVRPRTWIETDDPDKLAAYATIYEVMVTLTKLMAPFVPFTAESIYQNLVRGADTNTPPSVHMCDWQGPKEELIDESLEIQMALVRDVVEAVSNARQKAGRKLRWPVAEISISPKQDIANIDQLEGVLKNQTNAKKVKIMATGEKPAMEIDLRPVPKNIGPIFKGDAQKVISALKEADPEVIKKGLDVGECIIDSYEIASDMVEFIEKVPGNLEGTEFSAGTVYVDVTLSDDLKAEGYAREIIRRIQDMRKEMDLRVEDMIEVQVDVDEKEVLNLVRGLKDHIATEVRAKDMMIENSFEVTGSLLKKWTVEGVTINIGITRE
jgi:isoleucyl-tRNA synthetase